MNVTDAIRWTVEGNAGNDYIDGGSGQDNLYGGTETDVVLGGTGDDYIEGGTNSNGVDQLYGGDGNDVIFGDNGVNRKADPDFAYNQSNYNPGNGHADNISGGAGDDRFVVDQAGDALVQTKVDEYMSLLALMVFAFGLSFEFPLILLALQLMGVVSPDTLAGVRRHAIVGIVAVVAIVTPGGDPVSLFALSIPLCIFYEASIWIARLMLGRRAKNREATDTAA